MNKLSPDVNAKLAELGQRIADNRRARADAMVAAELVFDMEQDHGEIFWEELAKLLCDHLPKQETKVVKARPMNDSEADAYGNRICNYGKHAGKRFNNVPLDYLLWLDEQNTVLSRYLASDYVQREQSQ